MGFLDDYEPVEDRLARFWADHETGRVMTDLVYAEAGEYVVRAEVWRDADKERPDASGYAQELVTAKGVNSTSALENCETSAIGRALANLGYAAKGKRPSREEMTKTRKPSVRDWKAEVDEAPSVEVLHALWAESGALEERTPELEEYMTVRAAGLQVEAGDDEDQP